MKTNQRLIVIAGGSGFIGRALARSLSEDGHEIAILTRDRDKAKAIFGNLAVPVEWDGRTSRGWTEVARRSRAIINLAAPRPVRMREFVRTLGRTMKRPSVLRVPAFLLRLLFGQMAEETLLGGQKVMPRALSVAGFAFSYPELAAALAEILRKEPTPR